ncbi:MAG: T9SS type A sorting domain-containing protein [Flavobacteriales bacterium]|nr:T9SS type A sorting domain-containing protein [Flavobacteriales bacterium]
MGRLWIILFLGISFCHAQNRINFNGQDIYINGVNVPWGAFGNDMGSHHQWGEQYDSTYFENLFTECEAHNINTARLWVHCDGRANPEFDGQGKVLGLDPQFFTHLDDIFQRALDHDVYLILCLWSFDMLKNFTASAGQYAGLHKELITDTAFTNSYINNALVPIVQHYQNQCNLLAYEIMNEPEWGINGNPFNFSTVDQKVEAAEMKRFVGMLTAAIHDNSDHLVTLGASTLAFNSTDSAALDHYWSDTALMNATNQDPNAYLDFYQVHFWEWMLLTGHDPFSTTPIDWMLDKPTIIGEYPGTSNFPLPSQQTLIQNAYNNNWAGVIPWSHNAQDGRGDWNDFKNELKQFGLDHPIETDILYCKNLANVEEVHVDEIVVYPNPFSDYVNIKNANTTLVEVFDIQGKQILTCPLNGKSQLDLSMLNPGSYIFKVYGKNAFQHLILQKM